MPPLLSCHITASLLVLPDFFAFFLIRAMMFALFFVIIIVACRYLFSDADTLLLFPPPPDTLRCYRLSSLMLMATPLPLIITPLSFCRYDYLPLS